MQTNFEADAIAPSEQAPISQQASYDFGTLASAQTAITAVWQRESDRLLRLAYSITRRVQGDAENIVSDALVHMLEHWYKLKDAEHCRASLYEGVRLRALQCVRDHKYTVEPDGTLADPSTVETSAKWRDTGDMLAWLMSQCTETEQAVLRIWLTPGNGTGVAVAEQTRNWTEPWSAKDVSRLFKSIRDRVGVGLARPQDLRFTTKGGQTCYGGPMTSHYVLTLLLLGPRAVTREERLQHRAAVPHWVQDYTGAWSEQRTLVRA